MPIVIPPDSSWGIELAKWNTPRNKAILNSSGDEVLDEQTKRPIMGLNCIGFEPYPKMLYKAQKNALGKVMCMDVTPASYLYPDERTYQRACNEVEAFNRGCHIIVKDQQEHERKKDQGWCDDPASAMYAHELLEQDIANAAAEMNFTVRRMSQSAKDEHAEAGAETHQHVTDVVGTPKARRGRKPKKSNPVVAEPQLEDPS